MRYPIALKFGTQIGGGRAHLGKFGWNMINTRFKAHGSVLCISRSQHATP